MVKINKQDFLQTLAACPEVYFVETNLEEITHTLNAENEECEIKATYMEHKQRLVGNKDGVSFMVEGISGEELELYLRDV